MEWSPQTLWTAAQRQRRNGALKTLRNRGRRLAIGVALGTRQAVSGGVGMRTDTRCKLVAEVTVAQYGGRL